MSVSKHWRQHFLLASRNTASTLHELKNTSVGLVWGLPRWSSLSALAGGQFLQTTKTWLSLEKKQQQKNQNPSRTFTWFKKHPSYAPAANTKGQVAQQVGHECWPATVLLILSALAVRHAHIPLRVQEGFLDRAGHMTKRSQLLHRHISAARSHPASTWEPIIKRSATNILIREKGSTIISRKPSRLSMNQMFCSLRRIIAQMEDKPLFVACNVKCGNTCQKTSLFKIELNQFGGDNYQKKQKKKKHQPSYIRICVFLTVMVRLNDQPNWLTSRSGRKNPSGWIRRSAPRASSEQSWTGKPTTKKTPR